MTDLSLAKENQNKYVEYRSIKGVARTGIDLNVTVLTTGFWPTYKSSDLNLPSEMVQAATLPIYHDDTLFYFDKDQGNYVDVCCLRSSVLRIIRTSIKTSQKVESLHGFTHWELVLYLDHLIQRKSNFMWSHIKYVVHELDLSVYLIVNILVFSRTSND